MKKGDRIRLTSPIVNHNSEWMPVETEMPVGLEGTVLDVRAGYGGLYIEMKWDNGRTLSLLDSDNCYELIPNSDTNYTPVA